MFATKMRVSVAIYPASQVCRLAPAATWNRGRSCTNRGHWGGARWMFGKVPKGGQQEDHCPLPFFTSDISNENSSRPLLSCTCMDHIDQASPSISSFLNINSRA